MVTDRTKKANTGTKNVSGYFLVRFFLAVIAVVGWFASKDKERPRKSILTGEGRESGAHDRSLLILTFASSV